MQSSWCKVYRWYIRTAPFLFVELNAKAKHHDQNPLIRNIRTSSMLTYNWNRSLYFGSEWYSIILLHLIVDIALFHESVSLQKKLLRPRCRYHVWQSTTVLLYSHIDTVPYGNEQKSAMIMFLLLWPPYPATVTLIRARAQRRYGTRKKSARSLPAGVFFRPKPKWDWSDTFSCMHLDC